MIENPEFLKLTQNGDDSSNDAEKETVGMNGGKVGLLIGQILFTEIILASQQHC